MKESKSTYREILEQEDVILSEVLELQKSLREAVNKKDWSMLMKVISSINLKMDKFNSLDEERESSARFIDDKTCDELLCTVRGKLVRLRTENKVLTEYIDITRKFVRSVINATPQSRAKVYGRDGLFSQEQPHSVVVNALY